MLAYISTGKMKTLKLEDRVMIKHINAYQKIIYKYYPVDICRGELSYREAKQTQNRLKKIQQCRNNTAQFERLLERIKSQVNPKAYELTINQSYVGKFWLSSNIGCGKFDSCIFIISGMVNLFSVYLCSSLTHENTLAGIDSRAEIEIINQVSHFIKEVYPAYKPFPMELFHARSPGLDAKCQYNDQATYFKCLMAEDISN